MYFIKGDYIPLIRNEIYLYSIMMMAACGILVTLNSCFSNCAYQNICATVLYTLVLLLGMGLDALVGHNAFMFMGTVSRELDVSLKQAVRLYYGKNETLTKAVDFLQFEGACCGAFGFVDYPKKVYEDGDTFYANGSYRVKPKLQYIPDSCCWDYVVGCGKWDHPNNIYLHGCTPYFQNEVIFNLNMTLYLSALVLGIHIFELLLIFILCVFKPTDKAKHQKMTKVNGAKGHRDFLSI
ncbi:hypothetical protein WR25_11897 isoform C [Diploscapter pachys]|nr:hypothetical protein WR25_11897 isoform C [Diploscapter pachys]